jgi:hypothetical protein
MGWLATIALVCVGVLLVYLGWCWGVWAERREQASREEAIRKAAYTGGCEWSLKFWQKNMNRSQWAEMYEGHFDAAEKDETREGC